MATAANNVYDSLEISGRQIRLLTILPMPTNMVNHGAPVLNCRLEVRERTLPERPPNAADVPHSSRITFDHVVTNPPQEYHVDALRAELHPLVQRLEKAKKSRRLKLLKMVSDTVTRSSPPLELNLTIPIFEIPNQLDADDKRTMMSGEGTGHDFDRRLWTNCIHVQRGADAAGHFISFGEQTAPKHRNGFLPLDQLNPFFRVPDAQATRDQQVGEHEYIALSYAWGSPEPNVEIMVNQKKMFVRKNLADALERFRSMEYFRAGGKLWVDSLCINQDDEEEKQAQVQMMSAIYQAAGNIIVWLGHASVDSDMVITFLEQCGTDYRAEWAEFCDSCDAITATTWRTMAQIRMETNYNRWRASNMDDDRLLREMAIPLLNFFNRPYWRRLWIIQELCMGRSDMPMVCGNRVAQWRHIRDGVLKCVSIIDLLAQVTRELLSQTSTSTGEHSLFHVAQLAQLEITGHRRRLAPVNRDNLPLVAPTRFEQGPLLGNSLRRALILASRSACSISHDRVYGMLSIPALPEFGITVDYKKDLASVFTEFCAACVRHGSLDFFALLDGGYMSATDEHGRPQPIKKPSWVPDFAAKPARRLGIIEGDWNAGGYVSLQFAGAPEVHNKVLVCQGRVADEIDGLGAVSKADLEAGAIPPDWDNELKGLTQSSAEIHATAQSSLGTPICKLYDVLVVGTDMTGISTTASFECLYRAFTLEEPDKSSPLYRNWQFIKANAELEIKGKKIGSYFSHLSVQPQSSDPEADQKLTVAAACQAMESRTKMRRLCTTKTGLLGLAPLQTRHRDAVIVLAGHGKPVIARQNQTIDGQVFWYLIGEVYMPGMMQAEKMPMDTNIWNAQETSATLGTLEVIPFV